MQFKIRGRGITLAEEVKRFAEEKANKLANFGIDILLVDMVLEEDHNKTEDKAARAKMLIDIPGKNIEATGEGKTIFAAINKAQENAIRQLSERNKKIESKSRFVKGKQIIRRLFRQD